MSKHGRYERRKKKKGGKIALIILCVLVLLIGGVAAAGVVLYNNVLNKIDHVEVVEQDYTMNDELLAMMGTEPATEATEAVETTESTEPTVEETTAPTEPKEADIINVLVTGQSYREGETSRLADTLILVTINLDTDQVHLTSFLRDTYVDLPDYMGHTCGWNRINVNYALGYVWGGTGGAMEMTNMCIEKNFGIEVDYNVEVSLEAFPKIIDILGGVPVTITQEEADYINGMGKDWLQVLEPGETYLFGDTALEYARMRKAEGDNDSDIKRTARQRNILLGVFHQIRWKGVAAVSEIANEILPMISTNMTNEEITNCLMRILPRLTEFTIETGTCPVQGTYWAEDKETPDGWASVLVFASNEQKNLMMPITEGRKP